MRFLYAYIFCCLVFGVIVTLYELWKKTYRGQYILGTLLFPSAVFGAWMYSLPLQQAKGYSRKYFVLQWMWMIHAVFLLASLFIPYEFIGAQIARMAEPGIQTNHHVMVGAELIVDLGTAAIGGLVALIEFLFLVVVYFILIFMLVVIPRLLRPSY